MDQFPFVLVGNIEDEITRDFNEFHFTRFNLSYQAKGACIQNVDLAFIAFIHILGLHNENSATRREHGIVTFVFFFVLSELERPPAF